MSHETLPATGEPTPAVTTPSRSRRSGGERALAVLWWTIKFLGALFLFVGALQVMKMGAKDLNVLQPGGYLVKNAGSTLGLGWIGALFVLSGSPIAASALTLVAAGSISAFQGFTMLTGSRLGAAFVVLLVAVIYASRGGEGKRKAPLSTAVMALSATAVIYIPAALIGWALLNWGPYEAMDIQFLGNFNDLIDVVYGGLLTRIENLPAFVLFLGGLAILLVAFKVIDSVVPELSDETIESSKVAWLKKKWPMFGLGCFVALIAMSVSVALTVLVPLVAKGYVKRDEILPYIMGANITTLGDTLLAAFLLRAAAGSATEAAASAAGVRVVVAGLIGTTIVCLFLLAFLYPQLRRAIWKFQRQVVKSRPRLAAFTAALFVVPLLIIGVSGTVQ